jgi:hypothetical protein
MGIQSKNTKNVPLISRYTAFYLKINQTIHPQFPSSYLSIAMSRAEISFEHSFQNGWTKKIDFGF